MLCVCCDMLSWPSFNITDFLPQISPHPFSTGQWLSPLLVLRPHVCLCSNLFSTTISLLPVLPRICRRWDQSRLRVRQMAQVRKIRTIPIWRRMGVLSELRSLINYLTTLGSDSDFCFIKRSKLTFLHPFRLYLLLLIFIFTFIHHRYCSI